MDLRELKKLLKVLRDNGVTEYVTAELTLKIAEKSPDMPSQHGDLLNSLSEEEPELTEEELLFMSAGSPAEIVSEEK